MILPAHPFQTWLTHNLLSNTLRGHLAEYIVGLAVGADLRHGRHEWDNFDVITPSGKTLEVKSSAYHQQWHSGAPSRISFGIAQKSLYSEEAQAWGNTKGRWADGYVFAVLGTPDGARPNPLDTDAWDFYVVPTPVLDAAVGERKGLSLGALKGFSESCSYEALAERVSALLMAGG